MVTGIGFSGAKTDTVWAGAGNVSPGPKMTPPRTARALPGATEKSVPSVTCNRSASIQRHDAAVPSSDTAALVNTEAQSKGADESTARVKVTVIDFAVSVKVAFRARGGCNVGLPVV